MACLRPQAVLLHSRTRNLIAQPKPPSPPSLPSSSASSSPVLPSYSKPKSLKLAVPPLHRPGLQNPQRPGLQSPQRPGLQSPLRLGSTNLDQCLMQKPLSFSPANISSTAVTGSDGMAENLTGNRLTSDPTISGNDPAATSANVDIKRSKRPQGMAMDAPAMRVGYQGVPGAYSEMAALLAYPQCMPVPCSQFEDAFKAVESWLVECAVLPIENSLGGSIHRNYDLLLRHRLHIVGEVQLPVHHCLLALPATDISSIHKVMSHPQALAQCEMSLSRLGVTREAVDDTAGAAKMIAEQHMEGVGAVASHRAAEIYGLDVLADGIQDDDNNITRFLVLAREPIIPWTDRPFKTSIVFTLEQGPGVLFKALSVFALRDINLTKIESRPQRNNPLHLEWFDKSSNGEASSESAYRMFDYLFYIDFQASLADPRAQNALRHLQEIAPFMRVLGCYPMDANPASKL